MKINNLREVGPSRKILHARGVGVGARESVTRLGGSWGTLGATRKIKFCIGNSLFWPSQRPLLAAPSRVRVCVLLYVSFILGFFK